MAKKTSGPKRKPPLKGKRVEIQVAGRTVKGIAANFVVETDAGTVCRLDDGSLVKFRVLVEQIVVSKEQSSPGVPLIVARQGVIVLYEPAGQRGK
jgi:hypothetical protein